MNKHMNEGSRSYLVLVLDEAFDRTFTQTVTAVTGFDAGAHALSFDDEGDAREGGGYKVVGVFSSEDLRNFARVLDTEKSPLAPRYHDSDVDIGRDILISD